MSQAQREKEHPRRLLRLGTRSAKGGHDLEKFGGDFEAKDTLALISSRGLVPHARTDRNDTISLLELPFRNRPGTARHEKLEHEEVSETRLVFLAPQPPPPHLLLKSFS